MKKKRKKKKSLKKIKTFVKAAPFFKKKSTWRKRLRAFILKAEWIHEGKEAI